MRLLHLCAIALLGGAAVGTLIHFSLKLARAAAISESAPR